MIQLPNDVRPTNWSPRYKNWVNYGGGRGRGEGDAIADECIQSRGGFLRSRISNGINITQCKARIAIVWLLFLNNRQYSCGNVLKLSMCVDIVYIMACPASYC